MFYLTSRRPLTANDGNVQSRFSESAKRGRLADFESSCDGLPGAEIGGLNVPSRRSR
ncbi:unnamed protein product [Brugia timori]|uniref:Uncharacterized protein n=1 Tax=Brugia timori TaxID=42155 RepID=A0A0R3QIG0_9BILA|nr:unnamed protein product [Brugia timori]